MAEECRRSHVFVEVNGKLVCSMEEVHHLISQSEDTEV